MAILNFERGQFAFDRGEIGPGLLWMVETLRIATDAGDPDWKHVALANLSAWRIRYPKLRMILANGNDDNNQRTTLSPDGTTLLIGESLWDATSGQAIGEPIRHGPGIRTVAFSPDSKSVLTAAGGFEARLWDTKTGRLIGKSLEHGAWIHAAVFSPDGKTVLTGGGYKGRWMARLWDAKSGQPVGKSFEHRDAVLAVAFSPDGKTVLTAGADKVARLGRGHGPSDRTRIAARRSCLAREF